MQIEEDAQVVAVTLVQFVYTEPPPLQPIPPQVKKTPPRSFIRGGGGGRGEVVKNQH